MNQNISRILKILLFIIIITITDKVFGLILRKLYFSQTAGERYSLSYVLSECKADVLIFGNSRAQHHYDSRIISAALKMSCYNAGQDGGHSILLSYAEIKSITNRYSPKIIILEFSPTGIVHYEGDYDRLSILLPYYQKYPEMRPLILLRGPYEKLKLLSSIYPFNSDIVNIIGFNTKTKVAQKKDFDGYIPLTEVLNSNLINAKPEILNQLITGTKSVVDTNMVNALENIIQICTVKNITLFIINSPFFHEENEQISPAFPVEKISLDIIHRNKVIFFDFSDDPAFIGHPEWFADKAHLNEYGAGIFSNKVTDILNKTRELNLKNNNNAVSLK
jgi:hypothetical protein